MAKYTTQLRSYVESGGVVFDFDYPLFDPSYKSVLETKFINHFYFREIGLETIAQFKWFLKEKFNRIMPYYNQMYSANEVFKTYDPYKNKNVTTTSSRNGSSDSSTSSTSTSSDTATTGGTNKHSDTPQAMNDGKDYLTDMTIQDGSTSGESSSDGSATGKVTTLDEYTETIAGHDGMRYPTDILKALRDSFINIDQMILDECYDLFMNIY